MKRYLVIYLCESQWLAEPMMADNIQDALCDFLGRNLNYDEIYSITLAR